MRSFHFALGLMCLANATWAAEPTANEARVSESMAQILTSEASGRPVNRRTGTEAEAASAADHWQAGELLLGGNWTPLERIAYLEKSRQLKEYEALRSSDQLSEQRHRELAIWCKTHKLPDQERAHWYGVLLSRPDDVQARSALGHQSIAGHWYTPKELSAADEASQRIEGEWRKWMPIMRKLASDIASSNTRLKQQALERLAAIDDPSAISSLEVTACQLPADQAIPFVRAICRQRSPEACLALTRISFAYTVDSRGEYATTALRDYPKEFYVPELLATLSTPIESEMETLFNSKGELLIRRAMFRETKDEKQQLRLNRLVQATVLNSEKDLEFSIRRHYIKVLPFGRAGGIPRGRIAIETDNAPEDQIAVAKNALEDQREFESQLSSANAELDRSARAAYVVLEKTTGESVERTPQAWWNWWQKYNARSSLGKSTRRYEASKLDAPRAYANVTHLSVKQMSCLVAGTLVHTAEGPKAIESIRVGDMVVAQDVETGELALKPVLQTTIRPPKTTLTIVTDKGKIQATAGHRWFVAGKGWLMTRELKPDMLLHNATGTTRIAEVTEDSKEQETYNLVVDGFHTYFVGLERVLSFDNSDPIPTLRAVPGFGKLALD